MLQIVYLFVTSADPTRYTHPHDRASTKINYTLLNRCDSRLSIRYATVELRIEKITIPNISNTLITQIYSVSNI